jgi:hypothetical protein
MTTLSSGDTAVYDAWNRQTKVVSSGETPTTIQQNEYDGTNRRIQIFSSFDENGDPTVVEDDYHAGQQVVQDYTHSNSVLQNSHQYVWSPRYIDSPILRDTYDGNGDLVTAARVLYLADANYNVTGLVKYDSGSGEWQAAERYSYTPYGVVTYRNADWTTAGSSANANTVLYTGRTLDLLTSVYFDCVCQVVSCFFNGGKRLCFFQ